jgi:hypothetical protein
MNFPKKAKKGGRYRIKSHRRKSLSSFPAYPARFPTLEEDTTMVATDANGKERRRSRSTDTKKYAKTIAPKVALHYKEIIRFGTLYAAARLRQPLSQHKAQLSDLLPGPENAADIAAEAFKKLLSGERKDWDGNPDKLHQAIGSCINSLLSGRLKRHDNILTTSIDDAKLDWLYGDNYREDPYLEPAEEYANRHCKAKIIRRLLPAAGYEVEAEILSSMIIHRAFNVDVIADLTGMNEKQISDAFVRLAEYVQTDEFAIRLTEVFGEAVTKPAPQEIQDLASEIVRVRFGRN